MKKIIPLVLLLIAVTVSCEKFEEGGTHSASSRHIIGKWSYSHVVRNDAVISDSVFYAEYRNSTIEFEKGSIVHYVWKNASDSILSSQDATYVFNYNKKKMSIVFSAYPLNELVYEVKKLTKDEFWVEYAESDSARYAIEFIKLKE